MIVDVSVEAVVVYDSRLYDRGHMIRRWAESLERRFTRNAIAEAPLNKRTAKSHQSNEPIGSLKAGISGEVVRVGPRHMVTTISSRASYSLFVIQGTDGPITPRRAAYMILPSIGGGRTRFTSVSGQSANNFLGRAQTATARRHPSLRPFPGAAFRSS